MKKVADLIINRLNQREYISDQHRVNEAKEIIQEIALMALSRAGLFQEAAFQGETAFRLFHGLDRFSEDLDFALMTPDESFSLKRFLEPVVREFDSWGLSVEITDRSKAEKAVRDAFIKETSLGGLLELSLPLHSMQKLAIKIEIDTNPPLGATFESRLCNFPSDFYVNCYDLPSMFGGKLHAILCRRYGKGRDWYDMVEYLRRKVSPNLKFLHNALKQVAPRNIPIPSNRISTSWVKDAILKRIDEVDFNKLRRDVEPFVFDNEKISMWSKDYFRQGIQSFL